MLVKGLDFALMEQIRARDAAKSSVEDEESLENAFRAVAASHAPENDTNAPGTSKSKKRTREDIIRELKEKRATGGTPEVTVGEKSKGIEEAKQEGKFKPIGFKPIGSTGKKGKDKEGVKKKKRKADADVGKDSTLPLRPTEQRATPGQNANISKPSASAPTSQLQQPEPIDDDDIFADAGEYEGLKLDDGDDDSGEEGEVKGDAGPRPERQDEERPLPEAPRKWFDEDDEMAVDEAPVTPSKTQDKGKQPDAHEVREDDLKRNAEEEEESERLVRLAPLQSSALPSIRDILAADDALEAQERRKARKEKRKAGGDEDDGEVKKKKVSAETKLNRDYKKLKAYTDKKSQQ